MEIEEKDPSIIPEDIKEFIEQMHKEQQESRPDENWRVKSADIPEPIAPYIQNEDEMDDDEAPSDSEPEPLKMAVGGVVPNPQTNQPIVTPMQAAPSMTPQKMTMLKMLSQKQKPMAFAKGGEVPGYADGGGPDLDDPWMQTEGAGLIAPSVAPTPAPLPAPVAPTQAPDAPPIAASPDQNDLNDVIGGSGGTPMSDVSDVPRETTPSLTDQDFQDRANKMLGLNPDQQQSFLKMINQAGNKGLIGAGIAGIGDAIASGGTLGKVNPGGLQRSLEGIDQGKKEAVENMQTLRGNNEKASDLSQKLQAQDPNSPLSKYAQKAYGSVGKKLGIDLSHASAALISDVTGKGVDELNDEAQLSVRKEGLDIQRAQLGETVSNNAAMRQQAADALKQTATERAAAQKSTDTERQTGAAKDIATRTLGRKLTDAWLPYSATAKADNKLEDIANGVKSFDTIDEAEAAGLPVGSKVMVGGRSATIR